MTGPAPRGSNWTSDEDQRLLELVEAGKSWVLSEPQATCEKRPRASRVPSASSNKG
jgi:hypothetical protein